MMANSLMIDKWAHWVLQGGISSKADVNRIGQGEQVFAGECTNKKCGTELIDDEVYHAMHDHFINLSLTDKETIIVHYRLLPSIPAMRCNRTRATYLGLKLSTYEKRVSRAKKNMLNMFH